MTELSELARLEGVRALQGQEASLDNLRTRATALVGLGSVAASLFGLAVGRNHLNGWVVAAVVLYGLMALLMVEILRPADWCFRIDPAVILEWEVEDHDAELARYLGDYWAENDERLGTLHQLYTGGLALLALQVVVWAIALAQT